MTTIGSFWATDAHPGLLSDPQARSWGFSGGLGWEGICSKECCAMCLQAWSTLCRPHPPAGDEVGGDDLTLGEDHVSTIQEGEGRGVRVYVPVALNPRCL